MTLRALPLRGTRFALLLTFLLGGCALPHRVDPAPARVARSAGASEAKSPPPAAPKTPTLAVAKAAPKPTPPKDGVQPPVHVAATAPPAPGTGPSPAAAATEVPVPHSPDVNPVPSTTAPTPPTVVAASSVPPRAHVAAAPPIKGASSDSKPAAATPVMSPPVPVDAEPIPLQPRPEPPVLVIRTPPIPEPPAAMPPSTAVAAAPPAPAAFPVAVPDTLPTTTPSVVEPTAANPSAAPPPEPAVANASLNDADRAAGMPLPHLPSLSRPGSPATPPPAAVPDPPKERVATFAAPVTEPRQSAVEGLFASVAARTGLSDAQAAELETARADLAAGHDDAARVRLLRLNHALDLDNRDYVVGAGESLWMIAQRSSAYGNGFLWPLIWRANERHLKHPAPLSIHLQIVIPMHPTLQEVSDALAYSHSPDSPIRPPA